MKRKNSLLLTLLLVCALLVSACSYAANTEPKENETKNQKTEKEQSLIVNANSEPSSLDPVLIDNQMAGDMANQLFEGLVRLDKDGTIVAGVAEKWSMSGDGLVYTFNLNKNAKWSNGDQVKAEDFYFSWERALRPETAAPLGSNLFFIKNGMQYNSGEIKDPAQLGMKVIDESTFEVTLERPTSFFLGLTAFFTLLPINKEVAESNPDWASEGESFVSNGPFKIQNWKHGQEVMMVPNEHYWAKEVVKLKQLKWVMVNEQNTDYGMYQSNQLNVSTNLPNNIRSKLIESGEALTAPAARVVYLRYNHKNEFFENAKIRKALGLALNRQLIVDKVTQGGEIPALAFIPPGLGSGVGEFRELAGEALYKDNDIDTAKKLLAEGLKELGISSLPKINFLFQTNDAYNKLSQAIQEMWKQNLGVEVELQTLEGKVFVQTVQSGEYEVAIYGTGADYDDASNLMGQYVTGDVYNYSNISIPEYDDLVTKADAEVDLEKRAEYMVEAEKVLIDEMAIAPLYYGTQVYLQKENVKDIYRYVIQAVDYREAYVE